MADLTGIIRTHAEDESRRVILAAYLATRRANECGYTKHCGGTRGGVAWGDEERDPKSTIRPGPGNP